MIDTIECLKDVINHFFHGKEGFEEVRTCQCGKEYLAKDLNKLLVLPGELVLGLTCSNCGLGYSTRLTIDDSEDRIKEEIDKAKSVRDLFE